MAIVYPKTAAIQAKRQLASFGIRISDDINPDVNENGFVIKVGHLYYEPVKTKSGEEVVKAGQVITLMSDFSLVYEDLSINKRTHILCTPSGVLHTMPVVGHSIILTPGYEGVVFANKLLTKDTTVEEIEGLKGSEFLTMTLFKD
jgi:hypothetical protein